MSKELKLANSLLIFELLGNSECVKACNKCVRTLNIQPSQRPAGESVDKNIHYEYKYTLEQLSVERNPEPGYNSRNDKCNKGREAQLIGSNGLFGIGRHRRFAALLADFHSGDGMLMSAESTVLIAKALALSAYYAYGITVAELGSAIFAIHIK